MPAGSVRVSWAASDNGSGMGSYRLSVDGGPFQDVGSNTSANLTLSQGDHNVTVRAFDVAGNMAEAQQHVVVTEAEVVGGTESIPFLAVGVVVAAAAVALAAYLWRRRHRTTEAREGGQK